MKFKFNILTDWLEKIEKKDYIIKKLNDIGFESYTENNDIINITAPNNRPNATNLFSILNELSNFTNIKKYTNDFLPQKKNYIKINIKEKKICPIYKYIIIENINNEIKTNDYITQTLKLNDISTNNLIIDTINYVTFITGNPLHAYDIEKIEKNITLEKLKIDTAFKTINNNKINLKKDFIVIKDTKKILAIPGIIGSYDTKIDQNTKNILLECAYFETNFIKEYTKIINTETQAASIFKNKININFLETSINLTASLLLNDNKNLIKSDLKTKFYKKYINKDTIIKVKKKYLKKLLNINDDELNTTIKNIKFEHKEFKNLYKIKIPPYRTDISIKENILSEIIKIYGYENIKKINIAQKNTKININKYKIDTYKNKIKNFILSHGYNEIITYSFTTNEIETDIKNEKYLIKLLNPLSNNINVMRSSLLQGLIKTFEYNKNRKKKNIKLFEIGNTYTKHTNMLKINEKIGILNESNTLITNKHNENDINFFIQKKLIENIFIKIYKINNLTFKKKSTNYYLDENFSADIYIKNKKIGEIGMLKTNFTSNYSIKDTLYFTEFSTINKINDTKIYKHISKYPTIEKNISLIITQKDLEYKTIENFIIKLNIKHLKKITFINLYEINNIKKSINLKLIFQSDKLTLKDKNINLTIIKIKNELKKKFNIEIEEC